MDDQVLVINCGSSSVKIALFDRHRELRASALAERIGQQGARLVPEGHDPVQ